MDDFFRCFKTISRYYQMIKFKLGFYSGLLAVALLGIQCGGSSKNINFDAVSHKVIRFDSVLASIDKYAIGNSVEQLNAEYPKFFPLYTNRIIEIGDINDNAIGERLQVFATNQTIYLLTERVAEVFSDFSSTEIALNQGFAGYQHYFPNKPLPQVYTYISGLNQSVVTDEGLIGISLDKYLGDGEALYQMVAPPIAAYIRYKMHPQKIPSDAMYAFSVMQFPYFDKKDNLLTQMIYEGRANYFVKKVLPAQADTLVFGFTADQLKFCRENEERMWTYIIENKLLFITDGFKIHQYIDDAPFTKDFTNESPGRALVWMGYRMVEAYMKRNSDVSLPALMQMNDYQAILDQSRYNP